MSEIIDRLFHNRDLAWKEIRPAFDHAICLAKEAEFLAESTSNMVQHGVRAVYPPLVELLAEPSRATRHP